MINLYCFSATGRTRKVADFFAERLNVDVIDIEPKKSTEKLISDLAIIVFPVYCQNIPTPVKSVLPLVKAEKFIIIATYGKKSFGNVIYNASRLISGKVIAAAYVPIGHTYLNQEVDFDFSLLEPILDCISNTKAIEIPKYFKNPLADFFPKIRSQIGVKIKSTNACNGCGLCTEKCVMKAISKGKINSNCIRCLRCVDICPNNALNVKYNCFLKTYLKNINNKKFKLYCNGNNNDKKSRG